MIDKVQYRPVEAQGVAGSLDHTGGDGPLIDVELQPRAEALHMVNSVRSRVGPSPERGPDDSSSILCQAKPTWVAVSATRSSASGLSLWVVSSRRKPKTDGPRRMAASSRLGSFC